MHTTDEDIADLTLHHMGRTGAQPFWVVIGAMDGVTFDDLSGYISLYRWCGLFVEPIPELFRRLRAHYEAAPQAAGNRYANCAVAEHDGTVEMLTIDQDAVDRGEVHAAFGGMSAIYPPRNGLASSGDAAVVAKYATRIQVPCLTLATLFARHAVERIDVLAIDAEGWDYRILRQLDFATYRPTLIRCETCNLPADERTAVEQLLSEQGYVLRTEGQNLDAVAREYWDAMRQPARPAAVHAPPSDRPPTLVTALFDVSAGASDLRLRHAFQRYVDALKLLLRVRWPMVVFTQPELAELVGRHRAGADTYLVRRPLSMLDEFPFAAELRALRGERDLPAGVAGQPRHAAFALSKQFFLNDASIFQPFGAGPHFWVDGDIAATIGDPAALLTDECGSNLRSLTQHNQMLYCGRPLRPDTDCQQFSLEAMTALAGCQPTVLIDGRFFGGTPLAVNAVNGAYYGYLASSVRAGWVGSEEHVLTLVAASRASTGGVQSVDARDGLRAVFERLQHGVPEPCPVMAG
ncbi:MAG: FkbM family methyltransferase [Deltaproteobacteria bacterium]|nr:FkbM family methyltransferase [Deltaproteobacteria bacterium]